ncbi:MAG TPA: PqqD family peptide modification chaperone [Pyrinomonadaceae bacterium]|nr:PqqD family peptide modification chaperone [Pyrinomonadaceae bacterium]
MINALVSRKSNIVVQELENEVLIYDLSINKVLCLNQTAALVYQLCDGTNTVSKISDLMSKELKTIVSEELVLLTLSNLKKNNLLEISAETPDLLPSLSRREVAKKVGLASLVALPIIASVVAPSAVMAASDGLALNSSCNAPVQCQTGNCTIGSMLCCAIGVDAFADSSSVCAAPGSCASFSSFCCSGMNTDSGTACGAGGTLCVCA